MADRMSPEARSRTMSRIRGTDTAPEMSVRRFLHASGLRYKLHDRRLPGRPDLVFSSRRIAVFVHGCFWHGCPHCTNGRQNVHSNIAYWGSKLAANKARDIRNTEELKAAGWQVEVIWERSYVADTGADAKINKNIELR